MQIFATSPDPDIAARNLDDARLVKVTLEACQLLCTALYSQGATDLPLRSSHAHHPLVKWTATSTANWEWLMAHAQAMDRERLRRFPGRPPHKSLTALCAANVPQLAARLLPRAESITEHANCARNRAYNLDFRHLPVYRAYRAYLAARWAIQQRNLEHRVPFTKVPWATLPRTGGVP